MGRNGGSKFEYDETGSNFAYFMLTFASLVLLPLTWCLWPRHSSASSTRESEPKKGRADLCHCGPCVLKAHYLSTKHRPSVIRNILIKMTLILMWIALAYAFYYVIYHYSPSVPVTFDPFAILSISPTASKSEIKKAYHRLSLLYHPDKEGGDSGRFMAISKAYQALTDEVAKRNWIEHGNPDGPSATSFGIALPAWLVHKDNAYLVLAVYTIMFMVALPFVVRWWWNNSVKYGGLAGTADFKVLLSTNQLFLYFASRQPTMNIRKVFTIICAAFEYDPDHNSRMVKRESDNQEVPALINKMPSNVMAAAALLKETPPLCFAHSIKARALLSAHLLRYEMNPATLGKDLVYMLPLVPHLIQEFVSCCSTLTYYAKIGRLARAVTLDTLECALEITPLLVQALWFGKHHFLQIPHLSEDSLRPLFGYRKVKLRTFRDLAALTEGERRGVFARSHNDAQYEDVVRFLARLPLLEVGVKAEVEDDEDKGRITAGAMVTITVCVVRKEMRELFGTGDVKVEKEEDGEQIAQTGKGKNWKKPVKGGQQLQRKLKGWKPTQQRLAEIGGDQATKKKNPMDQEEKEEEEEVKEQEDSSEDLWSTLKSPSKSKDKGASLATGRISHSVHCPRFPADKQEYWWFYLTSDRRGNTPASLATVPQLCTCLVDTQEVELKMTAPVVPGTYSYTVNVRSDSYVELDYFASLKLVVHPAPKPVTDHPQWDFPDSEEEEEEDDETGTISFSESTSSSCNSSTYDGDELSDGTNEEEFELNN